MNLRKYILPVESYTRKNAPTILTAMGIVGVVGTAIMAVKDSKKADELIKARSMYKLEYYGEDLTPSEKVIAATPAYIPTLLMGLGTISCIYGANSINKTRQAMLVSAYGYLNNCFTEYKDAVTQIYGTDANDKVREQIRINRGSELVADENEIIVYEEYSGIYITTTYSKIRDAIFYANRHFAYTGHMSINEMLDFFDSFPVEQGELYGWTLHKQYDCGAPLWLDVSLHKSEVTVSKDVYVMGWNVQPALDYIDWYVN